MLTLGAALALCVALGAALVSARRALAVGRALDVDVDELAGYRKRGGSASALATALADTSVSELSASLCVAEQRACNEPLAELEGTLAHDDELHVGALRLAAYATGLAALLAVFEPLAAVVAGREAQPQLLGALDALAIGGGSFVSALATRRISARASRRRRVAVDRWVAASRRDESALTGSTRPSR